MHCRNKRDEPTKKFKFVKQPSQLQRAYHEDVVGEQ